MDEVTPEDPGRVHGVVRRIIDQRAAVGVSRRAPGFYIHFVTLMPIYAKECIEVTFNPDFVEIENYETDVIVGFGTIAEVESWLTELVRDLDVELCPSWLEQAASDSLFGIDSRERHVVDLEHPWEEWSHGTDR